jgi:uroporphyrinogen-III decarboxylase
MDVSHGTPQKYGPGELIPDDDPMHQLPGTMPPEYRDLTHLGLHRELGVAIPVHNYNWLGVTLEGVEHESETAGVESRGTWRTPHGDLTRRRRLAVDDGSWAIVEHPVKSLDDFRAFEDLVAARTFNPRLERVEQLAARIGDAGFQDIVLDRSPLGALVHDFVGMENFVYMLFDAPDRVEALIETIEPKFLEVVRLAAEMPARLVILGDNLDENLIAPPVFERFALPYYRKVADILHSRGKYFSCHMDGNINRLLPLFRKSGLDLYDGCTPEPMNNYDPERLLDGLGPGMHAFCGIPSTFFVQGLPDSVILDYALRIIETLGEKAILNVGDILPINGDIEQVRRVAQMVEYLNTDA